VLVKALPADATINRTGDLGGWTVTDHLLATTVDALGVVAWNALVGPHADPKKLRRLKPPERLARPGAQPERKQRRKATSADLRELFGSSTSYEGVN